ncbi:uncharacterized protein Z519_05057 [Cladophialophora bantiana CBS 173.52]|uniref:Small ribosomal subunit protein mS33 n=1 Tax=Cladophialophora bantiana (strain ATCC 10958 / CBS 173.52 / CDC B-1940 / NIH 8579) TaxID=1442370 RepID=A0A0D2G539_CLAB1|nr:uncharacterized protein Z519_05057 [Cladophialophora bantiana CBS 173.52]KIW93742.1 hypothetical protein Z519_05057 [Cladophialophora bantiana CBS 173.52]
MASPSRGRLLQLMQVCSSPATHRAPGQTLAKLDDPFRVHPANAPKILQLQCSIFSTTFNPMQQRLGNKVLRQRLRGPALASYYPRRSATVEDVLNEFKKFDLEGFNEDEDDRLENVAFAKLRGKGAPKKKKTAAEGRAHKKRK